MYAVTPKTVEVTVAMNYFVDDDTVIYLKRYEEALSWKQLCSIKLIRLIFQSISHSVG